MILRAWFIILSLIFSSEIYSQCNTDVSICTPGVAGPFDFIPASSEVGTCQLYHYGLDVPNYAYIILYITESGPLSLLIDGDGTIGYIDVSIFNIPSGMAPCGAITDTLNQISCNFAVDYLSCNEFGTYFGCSSQVPSPNVSAGDVLMIVVEDYNSAQNSFTLELGAPPNAQTGPLDASFTLEDHCAGSANQAIIEGVSGGIFSFNPPATDGAILDSSTGEITNSTVGATYSVEYTVGTGICAGTSMQSVTILPSEDASFSIDDFCANEINQPILSGELGGTFSFNPIVIDGATINPTTGEVSDAVAGSTYTIEYTTSGDCNSTHTETVTVQSQDDASFTLTDFQVGESNQATITGTVGGTFAFNPAATDGATIDPSTGEINNAVGGTSYTVEYTTSGTCPDTSTQTVNVTAAGDASFTLADYCEGESNQATITGTAGGIFAFNPTVTDGATIDASTGEISNGIVSTTYTVEYTVATSSSTQVVTVQSQDDASFTLIDFCLGAANQANITGTAGGTFIFNPVVTDGATIDASTGEINNAVSGASYTVEYTSPGLCTDVQTQIVNIIPSPSIINIEETCNLDLSYIVSFEIIGGDPLTYSVLGSGNITGNTFISDPVFDTDYVFEINDDGGCPSITIGGSHSCECAAHASIGGDISMCNGSEANIPVNFEGEAPWTFDYKIDGVLQSSITTSDNPYLLITQEIGTYTLNSVEDNNCIGIAEGSLRVTVAAVPTAVILGNESICIGETAILNIGLTGLGPWEIVYSIDDVEQPVLNISGINYSLETSQAGVYTIESVNTASCAGIGFGASEVVVHELPIASIDGDVEVCEDADALLTVTLSGVPDYELVFSIDGITQDPMSIDQDNSYDLLVTETSQYELISISDMYCTGSATGISDVLIHELPTADMSGNNTICSETVFSIPVELTGDPTWTISYSIDGVIQPSITSLESSFNIPASQEGEYTIDLIEDNYCSNSSSGIFAIEYYSDIIVDYSEDIEICNGDTAQMWATVTGGNAPYDYTWIHPYIINSIDATAILDPIVSSIVELSVIDNCGTEQMLDIPITVHQLPKIDISSLEFRCGEGYLELHNYTPPAYVEECTWIIDDVEIQECGVLNYLFDIGKHDIGMQITSPQGCYNDTLFSDFIEVYPQSVSEFSFGPDEVSTINPIVNLINESSSDVTYNMWTFGADGISFEENPSFDFVEKYGPGEWSVCLEVNNDYDCPDISCQSLSVGGELLLMVPNSFTPDGDGLNDLFYPVLTGVDRNNYTFKIYNRFGAIVFETSDVNAKWNGIPTNGESYYAKDEVYTWQIIAKALGSLEKEEYVGSVILLR